MPNLSAMTEAPAPRTFKPSKEAVENVFYAEFGPPEDASDEEKTKWKAWRDAVDNGKPQAEIKKLREALEEVMKRAGRDKCDVCGE